MDVKKAFIKTQLPATLFPGIGGNMYQGLPAFRPLGWLSTRFPLGHRTPSVPMEGKHQKSEAGTSPAAGRLSTLSSGYFPLPSWTNAIFGFGVLGLEWGPERLPSD